MNWNKMINAFIIIFFSINIGLLIFNTYKDNDKYSLSNERREQLVKILKEKNIELNAKLPSNYPKNKIQLRVPDVDKKEILEMFFGEDKRLISVTNLYEKYYSKNQEILFLKGDKKGIITYQGTNELYKPLNGSKSSMIDVAKKFVKDITLNKAKFELTNIRKIDNYYVIEFNEDYKDNLLFCSYVIVQISEKGIEKAQAIRYIPVKLLEPKQELYPIDEVLYNFMSNRNNNNKVKIIDIDLGYDLDVDETEYNSFVETTPYYRIKLDNGETYYVNAYINLLINKQSN